jgi:hypothetical protein
METEKQDWVETRQIKITCKAAGTETFDRLIEAQGKLKTLHKADYERLKERIVRLGFHQPITVWVWQNKMNIINGHQRLRTIKTMVEKEGFIVPPLPVNFVQAKNWNEAKRKILALTSTYGRTKKEGLFNFLKDSDLNPRSLLEDVKIADFDLIDFYETYYTEKSSDDLDLGNGLEEKPEVANPDEEESIVIPNGHVRMMQLVLETAVAEDFMSKIEILKARYNTSNVSDTVLNAVKEIFHEGNSPKKSKDKR